MTQAVLERAVQELGLPYISKDALMSGREVTGDGIGWDCSSLVKWAWEAGGVELPDGAEAQYKSQVMLDSSAALQPGDLLFFGTRTLTAFTPRPTWVSTSMVMMVRE